jgi:hypothetical protein
MERLREGKMQRQIHGETDRWRDIEMEGWGDRDGEKN